MSRAFARIAFTPAVQAVQARMGSRDAYLNAELGETETAELRSYEIDFIGARDSFYMGTVGENGWPYVQHRGGPTGFLKVLDARTIGFADFTGNRQYITVGNLKGEERVSLFLMDYPGQRRLKIWGRARLVDEDAEPALVARLESPSYRAPVERGVVITVEAFDWNCPKYITPRFTEREMKELVGVLPSAAAGGEPSREVIDEIGTGPFKLEVTGLRQLTPRVRAYELRAPEGSVLPSVEAGAHIAVPVQLPGGSTVTRQYSLVTHPDRRDRFEIAVLREDDGRGGSSAIHASWQIGTRLALGLPANQFPLHEDDRHAVLVAGGIGITPILAIARALKARGSSFELHYSGRAPADMAYRDQLAIELSDRLHLHFTRAEGGKRVNLQSVMRAAPADALFYVCGPSPLIKAARQAAGELGITGRLRYESFE